MISQILQLFSFYDFQTLSFVSASQHSSWTHQIASPDVPPWTPDPPASLLSPWSWSGWSSSLKSDHQPWNKGKMLFYYKWALLTSFWALSILKILVNETRLVENRYSSKPDSHAFSCLCLTTLLNNRSQNTEQKNPHKLWQYLLSKTLLEPNPDAIQ